MSWIPARRNMAGNFDPIFGIATSPLHEFLIPLLVAFIGRTSWITKARRKIDVLDDDCSSTQIRLHHDCETVLRLVQMREQRTGVSDIELLVPQGRASILLLKLTLVTCAASASSLANARISASVSVPITRPSG